LCDDRHGDELQTMQQPDADWTTKRTRAVGEEHEGNGGRQRKACPCRETAAIAGPHQADGKSDLAAGGAREELAQPYQIGISLFVEPSPAHDELFAEIPDVSNRPAEAGDTQLEEALQQKNVRTHFQNEDVSDEQLADTGGLQEPEQPPKKRRGIRKGEKTLNVSRPHLYADGLRACSDGGTENAVALARGPRPDWVPNVKPSPRAPEYDAAKAASRTAAARRAKAEA